jgi:hypothetical protein
MGIHFTIFRTGNDFSCTADDQARFFIGRRVPYEGKIGLYNIFAGSKIEKLNYSAANFSAGNGFWATFIEPTAMCEGRNFLTLNTYDRAAFTFGFGQFAAHVANGDFVTYFRTMLGLSNAESYFPGLGIINGRVARTDTTPPIVLEDDQSTEKLMKYLNPTLAEVEDSEVIAAARLIHWTSTTVAAQDVQVAQMVNTFKKFMKRADQRVGVDGLTADCCCVIADILHQGRAGDMTWPLIKEALNSANPLARLLTIGLPRWKERLTTLKAAIAGRPIMATTRWNRAKGDFV